MWHSMTESLIPPPVAHTISLRLRQVPYKVTEELQSHGGEGSIRERRYFSQKSLAPETSNPTRNPSHYITKLPFEILYAKVKSFPFHFLKTEEKKSLSKGRKYSSHNYSLDSAEFCRNIRPLVCRYVISHDYLEDPVKLKNEMVELLGTEIIAFMLDCFASFQRKVDSDKLYSFSYFKMCDVTVHLRSPSLSSIPLTLTNSFHFPSYTQ